MILPSKHLSENKALFTVGADLLKQLDYPKTVSALWENINLLPHEITFDWFILALDLLYMIEAIEFSDGLINRRIPQ